MYCIKCGKQMEEGQAFCSQCGASQNAQAQSSPYQQPDGVQSNMLASIPDHLVLSIISLLFFWPLGIAAIVCSNKVKQFIMTGNYDLARDYSRKAKTYSLICIGIGVVIGVIAIIISATTIGMYGRYYYY